MKRPVLAANWKMNMGPGDARAYLRAFADRTPALTDRTVIICPPALILLAAAEVLQERPDILIGIQNIYWEEKGAFTGENSPGCAHEAGARVALVGHSERRQLFGETDEETAKKCRAAVDSDLIPILCVGETSAEREAKETDQVVLRQLRAGLSELATGQIAHIVVAYEPVWAIGTGKTATPADAADVHGVIRRALARMIGAPASEVPILYGGSVNAGNAGALLAAADVDGLLVGGASLDPMVWASVCRA